jgi:cell division transport system permease protein
MKKRDNRIVTRRFLHSWLSSLISITLVLILAGMGGMLAVNAKSVSDYFKENIRLSVIFDMNTQEIDARRFADELSHKEYVKEAKFISKEQGTEEMKAILGEDFLKVFDLNPVPLSIDLFIKSDYVHADSLKTIQSEILKNESVREVVWQESVIELITNNIEKIGVVLAVFIGLLLFISFFLINNTVRLNVFSKRFNIHTMKLVGAKRSFIRKPFIIQGIWQGMISGILASVVLGLFVYFIMTDFPQLFSLMNPLMIAWVCAGVILLGILLCLLSTWIVLNRILSLPSDELYY